MSGQKIDAHYLLKFKSIFGMDRSDGYLFHLWSCLLTIYEQHESVFGLNTNTNSENKHKHVLTHLHKTIVESQKASQNHCETSWNLTMHCETIT